MSNPRLRIFMLAALLLSYTNVWAAVPRNLWAPAVEPEPDAVNPALVPGESLLTRPLTPAQHRAWMMSPPFMKTDAATAAAGPIQLHALGNPQFASGPVGDIFVMEGTNQLVLTVDRSGNPCTGAQCYKVLNQQGGAMQSIIGRVLNDLGDVYDSIVVWSTFEDVSAAAYYQPLRNDTLGLGVCSQTSGQDGVFGCQFDRTNGKYIQGMIFMNSVEMWRRVDANWGLNYGLTDFNAQVFATLGQESAHRWLAGFHVRDPRTGQMNTALLGRDKSHWSLHLDAAASVMDGLDWEDNGGGNFTVLAQTTGYSPLDLYGMGLMAKEEVEPFFLVDRAHSDALKNFYQQYGHTITGDIPDSLADLAGGLPPIEVLHPLPATGNRFDVDMGMIVEANGERSPAYPNSVRTFHQAFVLVTLPGQTASAAQGYVDDLNLVRQSWEQYFSQKTLGRGTMCTALSGTCAPSVAEILDVRLADDGNTPEDGQWGRGEEVNVYVTLRNTGGGSLEHVGVTLSTLSPLVTVVNGGVTLGVLAAGVQLESPTAFRVRLDPGTGCDVMSVPLVLSVDGGGQAHEFAAAVKACGPDEQPLVGPMDPPGGGGDAKDHGFTVGPVHLCACTAVGNSPSTSVLLTLAWICCSARRWRSRQTFLPR